VIEQLAEVFTAAQANNPIRHLDAGLAVGQVRRLPERALREAIVNGLAHREWSIAAPTVVEHIGDTLRVTSPGGFVAGITPDNIITHPSKSRNGALTRMLAAVGVAEQQGIGVDRMVGDMLRLGLPAPSIREHGGPEVVTTLVGQAVPDSIRFEGGAALRSVEGAPADSATAYVLRHRPLARLLEFDRETGWHHDRPPRKTLALDYAKARGRISTTELGSLINAAPTNVGGVLRSLEDEGLLEPSRAVRRGAGFYYRYVGRDQTS
jgi:ATP-dependent DNA helicase RecG